MANVHPSTVRQWVERGQLAAITLPSGLFKFRRVDVEALLTPTVRTPDATESQAS